MDYLVNSSEMKQYDKNTIEYYGVPSLVLMERAALAVFGELTARFEKISGEILILCGIGNNGGDGFALARLLHLAGYQTKFLCPMKKEKMTPEAKAQYDMALNYGIPEISDSSEMIQTEYAVIADALFGIGLSRDIEGSLKELIAILNQKQAYKIAVDISSGISADTGEALGTAFRADLTVTFGFAKIGQLLFPGAEYTGELSVAEIGIDRHSFLGEPPFGAFLNKDSAKEFLPGRYPRTNKGSYGKVLVIAGSKNMAGAAYFAAKAAYYSGCGLVRILTAEENRNILLSKLPESILTTYDTQAKDVTVLMEQLEECVNWADAVLIGPGISDSPAARMLVARMLRYDTKKVVYDADALNILSQDKILLEQGKEHPANGRIVTPHLGEMSRLCGSSIAKIQGNLLQTAKAFAREYQSVCVLKDARTVIGMPDGRFYINTTGNNGMATGGSGDVLAGFMTGFLAQGISCESAAALAVYLHGTAGDLAKRQKGAHSMLASDILELLPEAILEL